jgi:glycosyltransferase involved in cell wall biosynthesis
MKRKRIWFITRSYPPVKGGGSFLRQVQVNYLSKFYDVIVITPNYFSNKIEIENNIIKIPCFSSNKYLKFLLFNMDKYGVIDDYLFDWVKKVSKYIITSSSENDIVFSTSGGELSCFNIANNVKSKKPQIKIILHYHDLIFFGTYLGKNEIFNLNRKTDYREKMYLKKADYIISQSKVMSEILIKKHPFIKNKIKYMYFGYDDNYNIKKIKSKSDLISIGYIGTMGMEQSPEIILDAYKELDEKYQRKIKLTYIGNYNINKSIRENKQITKISYMDRKELLNYMVNNFDYVYLSLKNYLKFKPAMPTKFFEYIGLEIPIIGILPRDSEATRVIKKYHFGKVCTYGNIECIKKILKSLIFSKDYDFYKLNLANKKELFKSSETMKVMKEVIDLL